jgi:hypothetical protein
MHNCNIIKTCTLTHAPLPNPQDILHLHMRHCHILRTFHTYTYTTVTSSGYFTLTLAPLQHPQNISPLTHAQLPHQQDISHRHIHHCHILRKSHKYCMHAPLSHPWDISPFTHAQHAYPQAISPLTRAQLPHKEDIFHKDMHHCHILRTFHTYTCTTAHPQGIWRLHRHHCLS